MTDEDFMRLAIEAAREGIRKGEMPFGACVVMNGRVIATTHNSARLMMDTTAHAEVQAIREASRRLAALELAGSIVYTSCEPCPMCFSACAWARVSKIVYAARIEDASRAGIRQIPITSDQMRHLSRSEMHLIADVLRNESLEVFKAWARL